MAMAELVPYTVTFECQEEKRLKRSGSVAVGQKPCDLCQRDRNLLIRYGRVVFNLTCIKHMISRHKACSCVGPSGRCADFI